MPPSERVTLSNAAWRKSSHSNQQGACVEVATNLANAVAIRDSKYPLAGHHSVRRSVWSAFLTAVQRDEF